MQEMVNHPKHYNKEGRKECIVEMEEKYGTEAVIHFVCCPHINTNTEQDLKMQIL